jgi:hypothetical protein
MSLDEAFQLFVAALRCLHGGSRDCHRHDAVLVAEVIQTLP